VSNASEEFCVSADFYNPRCVEHGAVVGVADGGETMRNDERGAVFGDALGFVSSAEGFVKQDDARRR